jgi:putative endonuclease
MKNRTNREIGRLGEAMSRKYLLKKRFRILDMNFVTPFGEIDLVVKKNSFTIFVEVKTRTSRKFGSPLYAITATKRKSIIANSLFYLKKHGLCDANARIDIIAIDLDKNGKIKILEHVKNVIEL